jgi:hypothetical protein
MADILPAASAVRRSDWRRADAAADLADAIARDLRGEVRFDRASGALYATDLSIYRQFRSVS